MPHEQLLLCENILPATVGRLLKTESIMLFATTKHTPGCSVYPQKFEGPMLSLVQEVLDESISHVGVTLDKVGVSHLLPFKNLNVTTRTNVGHVLVSLCCEAGRHYMLDNTPQADTEGALAGRCTTSIGGIIVGRTVL